MEKEVLTLHLAEPWYSMIVSAEKMEEYREIKPHWIKRLTTTAKFPMMWQQKHIMERCCIVLIPTFSSLKAIRKVISRPLRRRLWI